MKAHTVESGAKKRCECSSFYVCDLSTSRPCLHRDLGFQLKGKSGSNVFGSKPAFLISIPNTAAADWMDKS